MRNEAVAGQGHVCAKDMFRMLKQGHAGEILYAFPLFIQEVFIGHLLCFSSGATAVSKTQKPLPLCSFHLNGRDGQKSHKQNMQYLR